MRTSKNLFGREFRCPAGSRRRGARGGGTDETASGLQLPDDRSNLVHRTQPMSRGALSRLDAPQISTAVIIEVADAELRVCAPPISDSNSAPSCTTVLASAPLAALKFESLDSGSLRIFDSCVSISVPNVRYYFM
jgi:hypothetical protein